MSGTTNAMDYVEGVLPCDKRPSFFTLDLLKQFSHFKCLLCDYETKGSSKIEDHVFVHCEGMPFRCATCSRHFFKRSGYFHHHSRDHPSEPKKLLIHKDLIDKENYAVVLKNGDYIKVDDITADSKDGKADIPKTLLEKRITAPAKNAPPINFVPKILPKPTSDNTLTKTVLSNESKSSTTSDSAKTDTQTKVDTTTVAQANSRDVAKDSSVATSNDNTVTTTATTSQPTTSTTTNNTYPKNEKVKDYSHLSRQFVNSHFPTLTNTTTAKSQISSSTKLVAVLVPESKVTQVMENINDARVVNTVRPKAKHMPVFKVVPPSKTVPVSETLPSSNTASLPKTVPPLKTIAPAPQSKRKRAVTSSSSDSGEDSFRHKSGQEWEMEVASRPRRTTRSMLNPSAKEPKNYSEQMSGDDSSSDGHERRLEKRRENKKKRSPKPTNSTPGDKILSSVHKAIAVAVKEEVDDDFDVGGSTDVENSEKGSTIVTGNSEKGSIHKDIKQECDDIADDNAGDANPTVHEGVEQSLAMGCWDCDDDDSIDGDVVAAPVDKVTDSDDKDKASSTGKQTAEIVEEESVLSKKEASIIDSTPAINDKINESTEVGIKSEVKEKVDHSSKNNVDEVKKLKVDEGNTVSPTKSVSNTSADDFVIMENDDFDEDFQVDISSAINAIDNSDDKPLQDITKECSVKLVRLDEKYIKIATRRKEIVDTVKSLKSKKAIRKEIRVQTGEKIQAARAARSFQKKGDVTLDVANAPKSRVKEPTKATPEEREKVMSILNSVKDSDEYKNETRARLLKITEEALAHQPVKQFRKIAPKSPTGSKVDQTNRSQTTLSPQARKYVKQEIMPTTRVTRNVAKSPPELKMERPVRVKKEVVQKDTSPQFKLCISDVHTLTPHTKKELFPHLVSKDTPTNKNLALASTDSAASGSDSDVAMMKEAYNKPQANKPLPNKRSRFARLAQAEPLTVNALKPSSAVRPSRDKKVTEFDKQIFASNYANNQPECRVSLKREITSSIQTNPNNSTLIAKIAKTTASPVVTQKTLPGKVVKSQVLSPQAKNTRVSSLQAQSTNQVKQPSNQLPMSNSSSVISKPQPSNSTKPTPLETPAFLNNAQLYFDSVATSRVITTQNTSSSLPMPQSTLPTPMISLQPIPGYNPPLNPQYNMQSTTHNQQQSNIPQHNIPQQNIPQQNIPQQNIPQQNIPQQNIPQQIIPQLNLPQQNIPQQNIPQQQNLSQQNFQPVQYQSQNFMQHNASRMQVPNYPVGQNLLLIPQQSMPQQTLPQQNVPQMNYQPQQQSIPVSPPIQNISPPLHIPANIPQQNMPQQNIPQQNIPQQNIPDLYSVQQQFLQFQQNLSQSTLPSNTTQIPQSINPAHPTTQPPQMSTFPPPQSITQSPRTRFKQSKVVLENNRPVPNPQTGMFMQIYR